MARLIGREGLSFEMNCTGYLYGRSVYQFMFLWCGESILNEKVFKRYGLWRRTEMPGAFHTSLAHDDWDRYAPTEMIESVLEGERLGQWEPFLEPDISITISRPVTWRDEFKVIVFADTNMLMGCSYYASDGISLTIRVTRESLVRFRDELEEEYRKLEKPNGED